MRTHAGERPFKCELCSASFAKKVSVCVHIKNRIGNKPMRVRSVKPHFPMDIVKNTI